MPASPTSTKSGASPQKPLAAIVLEYASEVAALRNHLISSGPYFDGQFVENNKESLGRLKDALLDGLSDALDGIYSGKTVRSSWKQTSEMRGG
jgi:hypothetical protein